MFLNYFRRHPLAHGVLILSLTQLAASVAGLVRERFFALTFASNLSVVDAYIAAFRPSDLLFQATIMSALGTVLVPVLARFYAAGDRSGMARVLGATTGAAALLFGALALVLGIFFPWIAPFLVHFQGETLRLYIHFGQIALLTNFLFVFGSSTGQYLITIERYWIYGITPVLYTLGTIVGIVVFTPYLGNYGPIIGTLLGALVYVLLRSLAVTHVGGSWSARLWHPELPELGRLMIPRVLSLAAFQAQLLFLDRLASAFSQGSVTVNAYARNFQSVLVGVVGIAVAQAVYSRFSQHVAKKEYDRFVQYIRRGVLLCLALTVPGAIALALLSPVAAWLVGLARLLDLFRPMLLIYAISIPFESINHIQYRAFYALHDTLTPSIIGIIGGVVAVMSAYIFNRFYGIIGVAIGYGSGEVIKTLGMGIWLMVKRERGWEKRGEVVRCRE